MRLSSFHTGLTGLLKTIFLIGRKASPYHKEKQRNAFRDGRCQRGSLDAHGGQPPVAEDEQPVQQDIAGHQHNGIPCKTGCFSRSHIESPKQCSHKGKEQSGKSPINIDFGGFKNVIRFQERTKKRRRQEVRQDDGHERQGCQEPDALPENTPDGIKAFPVLISLSVAPTDDDLDTDGEDTPAMAEAPNSTSPTRPRKAVSVMPSNSSITKATRMGNVVFQMDLKE